MTVNHDEGIPFFLRGTIHRILDLGGVTTTHTLFKNSPLSVVFTSHPSLNTSVLETAPGTVTENCVVNLKNLLTSLNFQNLPGSPMADFYLKLKAQESTNVVHGGQILAWNWVKNDGGRFQSKLLFTMSSHSPDLPLYIFFLCIS